MGGLEYGNPNQRGRSQVQDKDKNIDGQSNLGLDKHWHLSTNDHEICLTEIEFALFRNFAAFSRWMDDCAACCHTSVHPCNGMDYAVLNVVRMHERAKSISEIARLMNRNDLSNLQYSVRKLVKAELIEKLGSNDHKRGATYQATRQGVAATDRYAEFRRELLVSLTQSISNSEENMNQVARVLSLLSGIYDQAACVAASHRSSIGTDDA
ncbi:winged helix DNA-binding protein [Exilibacterium tricleocarpae]|uniref:winged helix DNA-binding protein n=1 Tax=Exilibacterium tricleocarpae TaxID=2591008 RepID=UPI0015D25664|nr:winged helix DNA-binding protein [Exilibacterium tricleocarpae]